MLNWRHFESDFHLKRLFNCSNKVFLCTFYVSPWIFFFLYLIENKRHATPPRKRCKQKKYCEIIKWGQHLHLIIINIKRSGHSIEFYSEMVFCFTKYKKKEQLKKWTNWMACMTLVKLYERKKNQSLKLTAFILKPHLFMVRHWKLLFQYYFFL